MRYLLLLCLLLTQTAQADPPSFWMRLGSAKSEGLIALQSAQSAYRRKFYQDALRWAKVAREKAPSVGADYLYGMSRFQVGITLPEVGLACTESMTLLQSVQERSAFLGDEPEIHLAIGLCAAVLGAYDLAVAENYLVAYHPQADTDIRFVGFMNLGDSLMGAGELDEAIRAYNQAYHMISGFAYVSFAMAVAHYRNHEARSAASALQRALSIDPDFKSLEDTDIIFVPEEDKFFFLAVAAAGNKETGLAYDYLGEYLSKAQEGAYRSMALVAFADVEAFSRQLNGESEAPTPIKGKPTTSSPPRPKNKR